MRVLSSTDDVKMIRLFLSGPGFGYDYEFRSRSVWHLWVMTAIINRRAGPGKVSPDQLLSHGVPIRPNSGRRAPLSFAKCRTWHLSSTRLVHSEIPVRACLRSKHHVCRTLCFPHTGIVLPTRPFIGHPSLPADAHRRHGSTHRFGRDWIEHFGRSSCAQRSAELLAEGEHR